MRKRQLYQRNGVPTYWVIAADARTVDVLHPQDTEPTVITDSLTWRVTPDADELQIPLGELFAE